MKFKCATCGKETQATELVFDDTVIVAINDDAMLGEIVDAIGHDWFRLPCGNDHEHLPSTELGRFREYLLACTDLLVEHESGDHDKNWRW